jgi:serine protease inhibitor ecotin
VAMACANFKSTQTMVPSWHIAKRMDRDNVSALPILVAVVFLILVAAVAAAAAVFVVDIAAVEGIDGMEQIAVIPQIETNFGFVATAGETGVDSTTRL